jgi:hypothetical protein
LTLKTVAPYSTLEITPTTLRLTPTGAGLALLGAGARGERDDELRAAYAQYSAHASSMELSDEEIACGVARDALGRLLLDYQLPTTPAERRMVEVGPYGIGPHADLLLLTRATAAWRERRPRASSLIPDAYWAVIPPGELLNRILRDGYLELPTVDLADTRVRPALRREVANLFRLETAEDRQEREEREHRGGR